MADRDQWISHIKELREQHDVSILDAERIALGTRQWRRWVEQQINADERCRRMALAHIRYNGDAALIERRGDTLFVR
ncbi:hypothetical protein [Sphingobium sp. D43FB]|uniref:hypothetical protein n=1 Tax=Sphingobium sp. D43FB TaxID=2017595 RepID=UPI000BB57FBF|nr:hypothetical protein [Sphingobium sp. D43FB]PBN41664.1 hypothetical protein SxD43FB_20615 [Sphingobium sp. D43FB]